jgi:hypothetical protein
MKSGTLGLILLLITLSHTSKAQYLRGGMNFANVTITNDGEIDRNNVLTSFQVGIIGDIRLLPGLFFQPGIVFTGKGSKTESGDPASNTWYRATSNPYYIEVPATFVLKTPTGPVKFFAGTGPYIAIGVGGKNTVDGKFVGSSFHSEQSIEWSNDDPSTLNYEEGAGYGILKRFDYGFNFTGGLQFAKAVLSVNYGLGLAKLQSGSNSQADDKNKHRVVSILVGIKL